MASNLGPKRLQILGLFGQIGVWRPILGPKGAKIGASGPCGALGCGLSPTPSRVSVSYRVRRVPAAARGRGFTPAKLGPLRGPRRSLTSLRSFGSSIRLIRERQWGIFSTVGPSGRQRALRARAGGKNSAVAGTRARWLGAKVLKTFAPAGPRYSPQLDRGARGPYHGPLDRAAGSAPARRFRAGSPAAAAEAKNWGPKIARAKRRDSSLPPISVALLARAILPQFLASGSRPLRAARNRLDAALRRRPSGARRRVSASLRDAAVWLLQGSLQDTKVQCALRAHLLPSAAKGKNRLYLCPSGTGSATRC